MKRDKLSAESPPIQLNVFCSHTRIQAGVTIVDLCCRWRLPPVCLLQIIKASLTDYIHPSTCQSQSPAPLLCTDRTTEVNDGGGSGHVYTVKKCLIETRHVNWWLETLISSTITIKSHFNYKRMAFFFFFFSWLQCSKLTYALRWTTEASKLSANTLASREHRHNNSPSFFLFSLSWAVYSFWHFVLRVVNHFILKFYWRGEKKAL